MRMLLNDRKVAGLKPPASGQLDVFDLALRGFGVRVGATKKVFTLVYTTAGGKRRRMLLRDPETGADTYPDLTLARARELAREALRATTTGRDPFSERKQAEERTFGALAELYIEQHARRKKRSWRDDARMIRR